MSFFIDFTVASALPLLCGYSGEDVMCWNPQDMAKSLNALEVNCGPWSDQKMSGTPARQNDALRVAVRAAVVVLLPMMVISGQSE